MGIRTRNLMLEVMTDHYFNSTKNSYATSEFKAEKAIEEIENNAIERFASALKEELSNYDFWKAYTICFKDGKHVSAVKNHDRIIDSVLMRFRKDPEK